MYGDYVKEREQEKEGEEMQLNTSEHFISAFGKHKSKNLLYSWQWKHESTKLPAKTQSQSYIQEYTVLKKSLIRSLTSRKRFI